MLFEVRDPGVVSQATIACLRSAQKCVAKPHMPAISPWRRHASDQPVQVSTLLFAESYYAVSTSTRNKEAASAMKENNLERNRVIRRVE